MQEERREVYVTVTRPDQPERREVYVTVRQADRSDLKKLYAAMNRPSSRPTANEPALSKVLEEQEEQEEIELTVRTPKDLHRAAKAKAEAEDVTISQLVRWWLRAWVDGDLPTRPPTAEPEQ